MAKSYAERKADKELDRQAVRDQFKRGRSDFYTIPGDIFWDDDLEAAEMRLLVFIAHMDKNPKRGCWASNAYLAAFCNCSEKTVTRYLTHFVERGFIRREIHDGERNLFVTDEYRSLLKGRYPQSVPPIDKLSRPPRHEVHGDGQIVPQYKDDVSEDVYKRCPKNASNDAPESERTRSLPDLDDLPVDIRVLAEERVEGRKVARPHRGSIAWNDMVRAEAAQILQETT